MTTINSRHLFEPQHVPVSVHSIVTNLLMYRSALAVQIVLRIQLSY